MASARHLHIVCKSATSLCLRPVLSFLWGRNFKRVKAIAGGYFSAFFQLPEAAWVYPFVHQFTNNAAESGYEAIWRSEPSNYSRRSAKCFIFHTSTGSVVFIIHLAEGHASHGRRDIIWIFKQLNTHKLRRPVSANTLQGFKIFSLAVWRCDPGYVALLESNNG